MSRRGTSARTASLGETCWDACLSDVVYRRRDRPEFDAICGLLKADGREWVL